MKILFVTGGVPSPIGQTHVFDLLRKLSEEHELWVVSSDLGEAFLTDSEEDLRRFATVKRVPMQKQGRLLRGIRSLLTLVPVAVLGYRFAALRKAVADALCAREYDLVVFEQLVTAQFAYLPLKAPKLLFPVDAVSRLKWQQIHGTINPAKKLAFALDYWITRRYETKVYRDFDGVLLVSEADAAYVLANRQISAAKLHILPLAVDTEFFTPFPGPQDDKSLVFLGNMYNYINEDAILWFHHSIWPRLKTEVPELKLYVVGNNPSATVRNLSARDPGIVVTGYLRDIRPPVWDATVFISPLRMGTGIKNRILQAMAMEKAIIASPLSVEGLAVVEGRDLLVADNSDGFFQKITFVLRNPTERKRLGQEARRYVERNHSLDSKASRFMEIAGQIARPDGFAAFPNLTCANSRSR